MIKFMLEKIIPERGLPAAECFRKFLEKRIIQLMDDKSRFLGEGQTRSYQNTCVQLRDNKELLEELLNALYRKKASGTYYLN